jgi:hypothetical protein
MIQSYQVTLYKIIPVREVKSDGQEVTYLLRVQAGRPESKQTLFEKVKNSTINKFRRENRYTLP